MREIKFRGKSANSGKWVYGYFLINRFGQNIICVKDFAELIIAGTEGQYAGFKDKNDKEIYEGDIIKFIDFAERGIVSFKKGLQGEPADWQGTFWGWVVGDTEPLVDDYSDIEIIGNIYENPELLK